MEITLRYALDRFAGALRAFSVNPAGYSHLGVANLIPEYKRTFAHHYKPEPTSTIMRRGAMLQASAASYASRVESLPEAEALGEAMHWRAVCNRDVCDGWAHIAEMISLGARYTYANGCVCRFA